MATTFPTEEAAAYLYRALRESVGLRLKVKNRDHVAQILYQTRAALSDPALDQLTIVKPRSGDLFIVHKKELDRGTEKS